jgi:uncharacterized protein (TIGR00299 family) protein
MVLGALLDAGVPVTPIEEALASLKLPLRLQVQTVQRCGFRAVHVEVQAQEDPPQHRYVGDIEELIGRATLTPSQRALALRILHRLAHAESEVHGIPLERVHLHEVGALDSIADIVGAAVGLDLLGVQRFSSRPVPTGRGSVSTAHGLMPVPTPGTLALLQGVPLAPSDVEFELTTPTGAAILTTVVSDYTYTPAMRVEHIGHGAGSKNFYDRPNILRLWVGEAVTPDIAGSDYEGDTIVILETHVDDVTPEVLAYCQEQLFEHGALDVFTTPGLMKKGRPGFRITVLAPPNRWELLQQVLFRESGTFGIRRWWCERTKLHRQPLRSDHTSTPIRMTQARLPDGTTIRKPEYEDCARLARQQHTPLRQILLQCHQHSHLAIASSDAGPAAHDTAPYLSTQQEPETASTSQPQMSPEAIPPAASTPPSG